MGITESSVAAATESVLNTSTNDVHCKESSPSSDECTNDMMPIIADVTSIEGASSNNRNKFPRTSTVAYGPIRIRKRHTTAPTIATGRRSKDAIIEGEDALKREARRMKNRESARNLKKLRDNIEQELQDKVNQLECNERELLTQIDTLQLYKEYLEGQCRQTTSIYNFIARTASAALTEIEQSKSQTPQHIPIRRENIETKDEPRSPSPQWQLLFGI